MDLSGPISGTRNGAFCLAWWRAGHASLELAAAFAVRMAANYLLASLRTAGSVPDTVRWLGRSSWLSLQYAAANFPTHGRALGTDDAGGAREVPPELALTLRRLSSTNQRKPGAMKQSSQHLKQDPYSDLIDRCT